MPERSPSTKRVLRTTEKMTSFESVDRRRSDIPIMQEGLRNRDLRNRFLKWEEPVRRAWLKEHGSKAGLALMEGIEKQEPGGSLGAMRIGKPEGFRRVE